MTEADLERRLAAALERYCDLLVPLVEGTLDPHSFELSFIDRYLHQSTWYDDDVFRIIDGYFSDVEEFVADPALRDDDSLGPEELLASTRALLQRAGML